MQDGDGRGGVGEGAQHPGDVAQRRGLLPALEQRPRRLALEVDDHPLGIPAGVVCLAVQGLAEVVVAVGADRAPADAELRALGDVLAHVLAAAEDRRDALVVGQPHEDPLDVLVDRRHEQRERLAARLLRRERRVAGIGGERVVQVGGDATERGERVDEHRRVGADLVESELPAVAHAGLKALRDAERRGQRAPLELIPAPQRRDVRIVARGQEAQHLELGIDPRLDSPEHLQHRLLPEHDRGVRLLDAHRPRGLADRQRPGALDVAKTHAAAVGLDRQLAGHRPEQHPRELGVRDRVDGALTRAGGGDDRPLADLVGREHRDRQLVELVGAGREARLDEQHLQRRIDGDLHVLLDLQRRDPARLGRVPALVLHPGRDLLGIEPDAMADGCVVAHQIASSPSSTSWNQ